jgi:outer membrane protein assembly factor BamB
LWRADLRDPLIDGPVVSSSGVVYQSTAAGDLVALSLRTGSQLWTFAGGAPFADADLSISPAVLATGTILWPAPNNRLDAISPTGRLLWSTPFSGRVLSPTVTSTGVAYVTDGNGTLEALRPTDRSPGMLWSLKVGAVSYSSPAVAPDGTVYAAADNHLEAITDRSGRPIRAWQFTAGGAIEVSPSVGPDGTVILGTNDRYEYGLSPNGQDKWRYLRQVYSYSSPAVTADGLAYFGDNSGGVAVVRDDTGMVVGRYSTATRPLSANGVGVWTAPAVDGRHDVYFGTASGHIFGFGFTGRPLFDLDTGAPVTAYPAIAPDGTLIIGSANGTLYAFKN